MHKTFLAGVIALALGTVVVARPHGQETAKPKAAAKPPSSLAFFTKLENERTEAVTKADTTTLDKMTSDDYTMIDTRGTLRGKKEALGSLQSGQTKISSFTLSDLKVRMYGNTAILTGRADIKGTQGGADISGPILFTRVYVKTNGQWQSVAFQQTAARPQ